MKHVTTSPDNPMGYFGFIPNTEIIEQKVKDCKVGDIARFLLSSKSICTVYSSLLPVRKIALQRYPYLPFTSIIRIDRTAAERWWEGITSVCLDGTHRPGFINEQLKHFPALQNLKMTPDCLQRTPEEIEKRVASRERDVSHLKWVDEPGIKMLADELRMCTNACEVGRLISYGDFKILDSCSQIHSLELSGCTVTDFGVTSIVYRCRNLKSLRLAGCNKITFQLFSMLGHKERNSPLEILDLSDCTGIVPPSRTDTTLAYITFPVLKTLNLAGCSKMNFWDLVNNCPQLVNMDLTGIPGIDLSEALFLLGEFPQLVNVAYGPRLTPIPLHPFTNPGDVEAGSLSESPAKPPIPDTSADSRVRELFSSYNLKIRRACIMMIIYMYGPDFIYDDELEADVTPFNEIRDEDIQNVWNNLDKSIVLEAIGTFLPDEKGRYTNRGV